MWNKHPLLSIASVAEKGVEKGIMDNPQSKTAEKEVTCLAVSWAKKVCL